MEDPDVIAYLFSAPDVNVDPPPPQDGLDRWVRAATEPPEERERNPFPYDEPCLEFRFSKPPKTPKGLVGGRCPRSDIVMPQLKSISWYHFALTFDHENRLVVRDLGSMLGTRVLYGSLSDEAERGVGVDFSTEGPKMLRGRAPIIKIQSEVQFVLVVPHHDITSSAYLSRVARFREGTADTTDLFADMALRSRVPTQLPTPSSEGIVADPQVPGQIMWKKELARGSFAVVYYAWDAQTREEYALKKPLPAATFSVKQWRREAEILKGLRHRNIVQLRHYIVSDDDKSRDEPELYFEYVPKGSLADFAKKTTTFHREKVTFQILSALEYLHGQEPEPIIHRDIKPQNVLVQAWGEDRVHVKLSDFGLSNQGELLKTFCGTLWYLAPEGYTKQTKAGYGPRVDIWSVGVLVFWLVGGEMPKYLDHYQTDSMVWAVAILESASALLARYPDSELLEFAIEYLLVPDHECRRDAWECRSRAQQLKSVAEAESLSDEAESLANSDGLTCSDESEPNTPRAQPADHGLRDSNASTIRNLIHSLGERDDDAVDSIIGMVPSNISSFERLDADTPEAECGSGMPVPVVSAGSVLEGSLWNGPVEDGEVMEGAEEEDDEEGDVLLEQPDGDGGPPSFISCTAVVISTETQSAAQYKRRLWDGNNKEGKAGKDEEVVYEVHGSDTFGQAGVRRTYKKARQR